MVSTYIIFTQYNTQNLGSGKRETKDTYKKYVSLFTDDTIVYIEYSKKFHKKTPKTNKNSAKKQDAK